MPFTVHF